MKVVHLSCVAPPEIGGIGRVALKETTLLRARGIQASLVAPEPKNEPKQDSAFVHRIKPILRVGNASILPGLKKQLASADIVHLHYPYYGVAEPLLLQADAFPPIVVTYHMDATADGWKGLAFAAHRFLLQDQLLKRAAAVIVSSFDYAGRSAVKRFFRAHPTRVREIPFGVETEWFSPGPSMRERFAVPPNHTVFLFVGGLDRAHAFKGVNELLTAFTHMPNDTNLLIVGDGDLRRDYEERSRELGIYPRVHFLGRVDNSALRDAYRAADIFVFPSTSRAEAFGMAPLEAESTGLPVIASDLPGVRTVVKQGETGLLVAPKDPIALQQAMLRLYEDVGLRHELGERARQHALGFTWDHHIDELLDVYHTCLAKAHRPTSREV